LPPLFFYTFLASRFWVACTIYLIFLGGCVNEPPPATPEQVTLRLVPLLQDPVLSIRRTAALTLGKIAHPSGIPSLVRSLADSDQEVRQWSAWALGNMGEELTEPALVGLIQRLADPSDSVRQAAALAIGRTNASEDMMRVLEEAFDIATPLTQQAIVQALSHFSFPFSYAVFLEASRSPNPFIRQAAIAGFGELGDPRGLPLLRTQVLEDPNVGVRAEAAYRLGKLGGKEEMPALEQARNSDPTPTVYLWSSWALEQIGQEL
jgi:HEAT repeat protein